MTQQVISMGVVTVLTQGAEVVISPLTPVSYLTPESARALAHQINIAADIAEKAREYSVPIRNAYGFPTFKEHSHEHY